MRRLESARTAKYQRGLVVFLAFFVCKHGGGTVTASIDKLQPSPPLTDMILQSVWVPTVPAVQGDTERRLIAAASARLLTEVNLCEPRILLTCPSAAHAELSGPRCRLRLCLTGGVCSAGVARRLVETPGPARADWLAVLPKNPMICAASVME